MLFDEITAAGNDRTIRIPGIDENGRYAYFKGIGRGWYQEEGKPAVEILPGTVIHIPANVKHWHGAAADSWFAHLAFEVSGENTSNEWLELVTDEEYDKIERTK